MSWRFGNNLAWGSFKICFATQTIIFQIKVNVIKTMTLGILTMDNQVPKANYLPCKDGNCVLGKNTFKLLKANQT